ncbi:hypothetical protein EC957_007125 [Mortierella hygrophila]|uniref:Uncharacterized protein n=1 Tax=Mortierella hygrophila TaxID=979708 RepID=A0A9P6EYY8_9FUNG|nr:hypothetical protein EC957_007125 [Mortierella hygrophila]
MNQPKGAAGQKSAYVSTPPSPDTHTLSNLDNSNFYSSPYIEPKRKHSTMLPSPPVVPVLKDQATRDFFHLPSDDDMPYATGIIHSRTSPSHHPSPAASSNQPKVNILMSSPPGPRASLLAQFRTLDTEDRYRVNPADVPPRPTSANANLSDNALRGLKRLSNEALATNRGGSPVSAPIANSTNGGGGHSDNNSNNSNEEDQLRLLFQKIDSLNEKNNKLEYKLAESAEQRRYAEHEQRQTRQAYEQLTKEKHDLQAKLDARERDYQTMSKNYLEHVRLIRATDDDHSTIIDRLTQLKSFIEQMVRKAQGSRSCNLNRTAAIDYLKSYGLLETFPVAEKNLEPFHINLFMESVVMNVLVSRFFDQPLCCVFEYNKGFAQIYDWMNSRNHSQAVRWRQQLCLMLTQDPEIKSRQEKEVAMTADALTELITKVYHGSSEGLKIRDICNRAFDLSVAMTGIDSVIKPSVPPLNIPFDEEYMKSSLKSNPQGKVALVIFPAFKDQEENFNIGPKVWCY